jgi:hypothetical protein
MRRRGLDSSYSERRPEADFFEHGNEQLGCVSGGRFLVQLHDSHLLKSNSILLIVAIVTIIIIIIILVIISQELCSTSFRKQVQIFGIIIIR